MAAAYQAILNRRRHRGVHTVPRVYNARCNHLATLSDDQLLKKYRLHRGGIEYLCQELHDDLARPTKRSNALSVSTQVLVALRYFATGSFQEVTGDTVKVSRFSVSRCVHRVADAIINRLMARHIRFPTNNVEQRNAKAAFYELAHFPNVLGTLDGSLVPVIAPKLDEHLFVCRKGYHAINVQGVIGADGRFLDIVARWPGSTHDSFIWKNSALAREMTSRRIKGGWLLGDSAYGLAPWLLTPIKDPANRSQVAYNRAHRTTRSVIERGFGRWKLRFRCLHKTGGCLMFCSQRCLKVIVATAILHNICIERGTPLPEDYDEDDVEEEDSSDDESEGDDEFLEENQIRGAGLRTRNQVIEGHFMN